MDRHLKANELRIGNWVKIDPDSKSFAHALFVAVSKKWGETHDTFNNMFKQIDLEDIQIMEHDPSGFYIPILLIPEILEKAGFEHDKLPIDTGDNDWALYFRNGEIVLSYASFHYTLFEGLGYKYVHQLQNLYFALTGEELEIKL